MFYANRTVGAQPTQTLTLTLPAAGTWVDFGLGGRPGKPSVDDLDCLLVASSPSANLTVPLMVRVRKNANKLKARERDRFLLALAKLNTAVGSDSERLPDAAQHARAGRRSRGTPGTSVPAVAPGVSARPRASAPGDRSLRVDALLALRRTGAEGVHASRSWARRNSRPTRPPWSASIQANPLVAWVTDSVPGILRSATFNTLTQPAPGVPGFELLDQAETLALGAIYPAFSAMEGTPHGAAHVSFNGWVSDDSNGAEGSAVLHAALERRSALGALAVAERTDQRRRLQHLHRRRIATAGGVNDTMWPWNGVITPPRPNFAPGSGLPASPLTPTPGTKPTVRSAIDYHGSRVGLPLDWLGFSYDDVPFDFTA